jgi:hypothetical protein
MMIGNMGWWMRVCDVHRRMFMVILGNVYGLPKLLIVTVVIVVTVVTVGIRQHVAV